MRSSASPRLAPSDSSAGSPRMRRQRRRRSVSASVASAMAVDSEDLRENGEDEGGALVIDVAVAVGPRVGRGETGRKMAHVLDLLAHAAAFRRREIGEGAAQQRQQLDENIGRELANPFVEGDPKAVLMEDAQ